MKEKKVIRVLVVEDSSTCRELLVSLLQYTPDLQVVGTAGNGAEAVRLAKRLRPDMVAMDVFMPVMDGYTAVRQIMSEAPCPIVMVSGRFQDNREELSFKAFQAGALSIVRKPSLTDPQWVHDALLTQLRLMSEVKVLRRRLKTPVSPSPETSSTNSNGIKIVCMAASTGGPAALATILSSLPVDLNVPVLIVQHVTSGFGSEFVQWLDQQTPLKVSLGRHDQLPKTGEVIIAPDDYQMGVNQLGAITLSKEDPPSFPCPSADHLFHSVAKVYGKTAVGIILTGMGEDGAEGLHALQVAGAHTIAQDKNTSVIFGMPAVAIKLGAAAQVLPLERIAHALLKQL